MTSWLRRGESLGGFVATAFCRVLRREATTAEIVRWTAITKLRGHAEVLNMLFESGEYAHRHRVDDLAEVPGGHYYSPVIDPEALRAAGFSVDREAPEDSLLDIDLRPAAMLDFWRRNIGLIAGPGMAETLTAGQRYYTHNDAYAGGDASVLQAMLAEMRPRRIIEVGSGFSSACMLDAADRQGLEVEFTFIEPYPDRLHSLLTDKDRARCVIHPKPVQDVDTGVFEALEAGDLLFIDSTHVSKTGSDVNYELFEILPRLKAGVIIHFHDVFYPFEYPDEWVFQARRSWNEVYLLRAYLAYNTAFEVIFFNDYFRSRHREEAAKAPCFLENPGGGLWLRKL